MTKILFICHGNICRSPMAEFIMKSLVNATGFGADFEIASAATSDEEIGNPIYPQAQRELALHGIGCSGKTARQMTPGDYKKYDLLIGMDSANLRNMHSICFNDPDGKIHLLMDYTDTPRSVSDPWYTRDFQSAWSDIYRGCQGLLEHIIAI